MRWGRSTAIVSVILSAGKRVPMLFATASGCLAALLVSWFLSPRFGVGAAVLSVAVYNLVNMSVTHFWYLPRYFNIKAIHQVVKVMLPPVVAGATMCFAGRSVIDKIGFSNDYMNVAIGVFSGTLVYALIIMTIYIRPREARELYLKIKTI